MTPALQDTLPPTTRLEALIEEKPMPRLPAQPDRVVLRELEAIILDALRGTDSSRGQAAQLTTDARVRLLSWIREVVDQNSVEAQQQLKNWIKEHQASPPR